MLNHIICLIPAVAIFILALFRIGVRMLMLISIAISISITLIIQKASCYSGILEKTGLLNSMFKVINGYLKW